MKNCQEKCLISAKEIIRKRRENWFTLEEIKEDFKKNDVKSRQGRGGYKEPAIRSALKDSDHTLRGSDNKIFELAYKDGKKGYKIRLMYLDEKPARREINKKLEEIEKRLSGIEKGLKGLKNIKEER